MPQNGRNGNQVHRDPADIQVEICQTDRHSCFADIQHQYQQAGQLIAGFEDIDRTGISITNLAHILTKQDFSCPYGKWERSAKKARSIRTESIRN